MRIPSRFRLFRSFSVSLSLVACLALSTCVFAQSTISFVPAVNTTVGGGKVCSAKTDANGDGCPATQATLSGPWETTSDAAGNLYIGDNSNKLIRRVDAKTNVITTIAGGGTACAAATNTLGDGCPATQATFATARGLSISPVGVLAFTDATTSSDYRIRGVDLKTGLISTLAGTGAKATKCPVNTAPLPANQTALAVPYGTAYDAYGNLYIADSGLNCVDVVVATNGVIDPTTSLVYTLVGNGSAAHSGFPGPASSAAINQPHKVSVDSAGNVYIAENGTNYVDIVMNAVANGALNLSGATIAVFAGTGTAGYTGDGGPATSAALDTLQGVFADNAGNVFISQQLSGYDAVRAVSVATGTITSLIGTGTRANTGDGGQAAGSQVSGPTDTSEDRFGRIFVNSNSGNTVRTVALDNVFPFSAVGAAGPAQNVVASSPAAATLATAASSSSEFTVGTLSGCATGGVLAANTPCILPVTFNPALPGVRTGAVTLTDSSGNASILPLTGYGVSPQVVVSGSTIATVAGTGTAGNTGSGSAATSATVSSPRGGRFDGVGNFYFADSGNNEVRRIDHATGKITVVAGTGVAGYSGDKGAATSAQLNSPSFVYVDGGDNLYIADTGNHSVRYVNAATGAITTIAGTGSSGYSGDGGVPTQATFHSPQGLTVDPGGNVYVADTGNDAIRRFNIAGGQIATLIGNGNVGYAGDGGQAIFGRLSGPTAVVWDLNGNLYIADAGNNVVRQVSPLGILSTFAGRQGTSTNTGDGGPALSASFASPTDLATDAAGDVYIATGSQVRMVNGNGIVLTVAGTSAGGSYSGEGGDATLAVLPSPVSNVAVDGSGNVYAIDTGGNRILEVASATPRTVAFGSQSVGGTSATQTFVLTNSGNSALTISSITVPAGYSLNTGSPTECASTSTIAIGATCSLDITFTPTGNGSANGSITITDNSLNASSSVQTIPLTGKGSSTAVTTTTVAVTPATIVYGTAASATATIAGGNSPTGQVAFSVDGVPAGSATVSNGSATQSLGVLQAGQHVIAAAYTGDTSNGSSGGSVTINVAQATLTVTAANATKHMGDPNPTFTYSISGFVNGDAQTVVSGTPAITTTATTTSAQGTYPITPSIGTLSSKNYSFAFVAGTLTVTAPLPADFTLALSVSSLSVAQGSVGTLTTTLTPLRGYNSLINLSCTNLPTNVTCAFNSAHIQMDGSSTQTTTLTIGTIGVPTVAAVPVMGGSWRGWCLTLLLFGVSSIAMMRRSKRQLIPTALCLGLLAVLGLGLTGCADAIGSSVASTGTNTITVTGADANGGTHSATLTVTVTQP